MAKQGQHKHDRHDHRLMPAAGRNNPRKATPMTTGTPKRRETYAEQAREHEDPAKQAQETRDEEWNTDTRRFHTHEADSRAREHDRKRRSGSDSNANAATRGH
jgi:hypothetical protein